MYVKSIAVAVQALCIVSIGPLADDREVFSDATSQV